MTTMTSPHEISCRLDHELEHGKKLVSEGPESVWNWSSSAGRKRADRRASYLAKVGRISLSDKVLEIGCGTGLFTRKVREITGAHIIATDISEDLLQIARKEFPAGEFLLADAVDTPFCEGEFDVVFGSSILHHLDFKKTQNEILRVLKSGGRMVFAEPNMLNPQIFIQKNVPFIKKALGDSPDETAVVRWRLARMMSQAGFVNIRIFPYDFLHPATPAWLIPLVDGLGRTAEKIPIIREIAGSVIIYGEKP